MVAAMAPKAHLTIVSYNAPNSERGFIDAAATAASDAGRHPAAVSISWGAPEDHWSPQGMRGTRRGVRDRRAARRDVQRRRRRRRIDQRRARRLPASRVPGVEPACLGVRRHHPAGGAGTHPDRDGLERALARRRCCRKRRQQRVPRPGVPGRARDPTAVRRRRRARARAPRRIGQRRSADRMERGGAAPAPIDRWDERRCADVHGTVDAGLRAARASHRTPASGALRPRGAAGSTTSPPATPAVRTAPAAGGTSPVAGEAPMGRQIARDLGVRVPSPEARRPHFGGELEIA